MRNEFYNDFDQEVFEGERTADYRSPFQVDRDRVIHSQVFRRLQSKTQVFLSGEYDFYRTRLTHSIEVAQIGRSICHFLKRKSGALSDDFFVDPDLVEAVCLSHDLGHPPFGHSGESSLQELMAGRGGFEGNAQTLRLLTEIFYLNETGARGMRPTRALLDGVLKYKTAYGEFPERPRNHFIYDEQTRVRAFVFGRGEPPPPELTDGAPLNAFKSIECQIMDWADDAAYSLNDIVDGVQAGFLTIERVENWAAGQPVGEVEKELLGLLFGAIRSGRLESTFARHVGAFIETCGLRERENLLSQRTNRYRFGLVVDERALRETAFFKRMANDLIFHSPQLLQIEHKARKILFGLWRSCWENYVETGPRVIEILPPHVGALIKAEPDERGKARRICDWLAGLTDGLIIRTYKRLNEPDFGSIRDLS
jgi:dGTPase